MKKHKKHAQKSAWGGPKSDLGTQTNNSQTTAEPQVQGRIQTIKLKDTYARCPVQSLQEHFTLWLISYTQILPENNQQY